jgi:hypothetical protein
MRYIQSPRKGVTEFMVHPVAASEELFAYDTENADFRVADAECLMDESVRAAITAHRVHLIGFRPLCQAMRGGAAAGMAWKPSALSDRFVAGTGGSLPE